MCVAVPVWTLLWFVKRISNTERGSLCLFVFVCLCCIVLCVLSWVNRTPAVKRLYIIIK